MPFRLLPDYPELSWKPYGWLVFSIPFALVAVFFGPPAFRAINLAAFGLFLTLYFLGYWVNGWRLVAVIIAIGLLGALFIAWNPGANSFFIYAGAFCGQLEKRRSTILGLVLLTLSVLATVWIAAALGRPVRLEAWLPAFALTPIIGGTVAHDHAIQRANAKLRRSQEEVTRLARVAERERIARDLHDLLGHTLSVIVLKSELAAKLTGRDPERAAAEIQDVERISRQALQEVRQAVSGYRHASIEEELQRAQEALAAALVEAEVRFEPVPLPAPHESVLALALREAVTNVIRHARATHCRLRLATHRDEVRLEVQDDGRGTDAPEGAGLAGMRERVAALGGRLERRTGDGTRLLVALPLEARG